MVPCSDPLNSEISTRSLVYIQAEMRERLAKDTGATYTYSMDYVSQTVSLVDEFRLKEDQEVNVNTDPGCRYLPRQAGLPSPPPGERSPFRIVDKPTAGTAMYLLPMLFRR